MEEPMPFHTLIRHHNKMLSPHLEHSYRSLMELIPQALLILDTKGVCIHFNQAATQLLGSANRTLLGASILDFFPQHEHLKLRQTLAEIQLIAQTQPNRQKHGLCLPDGRRVPVEISFALVSDQDGRAVEIQCLIQEIVERRGLIEPTNTEEQDKQFIHELYSTLDLELLLELVIERLAEQLPSHRTDILLIDEVQGGEHVWLAQRYDQQFPLQQASSDERSLISIEDIPLFRYILSENQGVCVLERQEEMLGRFIFLPRFQSYIIVPVSVPTHTLGFVVLARAERYAFAHEDLQLLQDFTKTISPALHNAMFFEQTQQLATLQERQRLARELHDAVSQTLFSANIFVEMLPRLYERQPDQVWEYIDQLQRLIKGALGEMRSLLYELRPNSLAIADLSTLLGYLVDAVSARTEIDVQLSLNNMAPLPVDIKIALYRISQEALNNALKHSHATQIQISLSMHAQEIELHITDNGIGFSQEQSDKGQLGLDIIRERAATIGAVIDIHTSPGHGVHIALRHKMPPHKQEVDDDRK